MNVCQAAGTLGSWDSVLGSGCSSPRSRGHSTPTRAGRRGDPQVGCAPCREVVREQRRVHGRRDGAGVPRRAARSCSSSPSPAPPRRCCSRPSWPPSRSVRWWPATSGSTATSRSRGGCSRSACCGAASSPPRPRCSSRGSAAWSSASPSSSRSRSSRRSPRSSPRGCSWCCCCGGGATSSTAILDGIVYAGMVGIGFAFIENILYLAAAYNGTDGMGPGGTGALTAMFVRALPVQPVRPPAVHDLHRHRRRHRGRQPQPRASGSSRRWPATCSPWSPTRLWNASTLYGFTGFVRRLPRA